MGKAKKPVSEAAAAQAAAMRKRLDELAEARRQREADTRAGAAGNTGGGSVRDTLNAAKSRTGRRGNR